MIICLNEHWLNKYSIFIVNSIPNYTLAHHYCREEGNHNGSCILLDSSLEYKVRDDLCTYYNEDRVLKPRVLKLSV